MINIHKSILDSKLNNKAYYHPNFFSEVPTWDDFLYCIFEEIQIPNPELAKNMYNGTDVDERLVGNVIITENFYFSPQTSDTSKYFKTINKFMNHFKDEYNIRLGLSGAKISFGPRDVAEHSDKWDGFALQCQGTSDWVISHKISGYTEEFRMSQGDLLFFPKDTAHKVTCTQPRATMIFNCTDVDEYSSPL